MPNYLHCWSTVVCRLSGIAATPIILMLTTSGPPTDVGVQVEYGSCESRVASGTHPYALASAGSELVSFGVSRVTDHAKSVSSWQQSAEVVTGRTSALWGGERLHIIG